MAAVVSPAHMPSGPLSGPPGQVGVEDGDTQTDSLREPLDLHQALIDIDEELGEDDLEVLKFLCRDHISVSKLEKAESALDIFDMMKKMQLIEQFNQDFLLECLGRLHRFDLVKKLNLQPEAVRAYIRKFKQLKPFRALLMDIIDDLDDVEVEKVRFFLRGRIRKKPLNDRKTLLQLFVFLEQEGMLGEANVDLLTQILESLRRGDLVDAILEFQGLPPKYGKKGAGLQPSTPYEKPATQHTAHVGTGVANQNASAGDTDSQNLEIQRSESAGTISVTSEESAGNSVRGTLAEPLLGQVAEDVKTHVTDLGIQLGFTNQELGEYEARMPDLYERTVKLLQDWQQRIPDKGRIPSRLHYVLSQLGLKQPAERVKSWILSFSPTTGPSPRNSQEYVPTGPPEDTENRCVSLREARPVPQYLTEQLQLQRQHEEFLWQQQMEQELRQQQEQQLQQQILNQLQRQDFTGNQIPHGRTCAIINGVAVYEQGGRIVANPGISQPLEPPQNLPPNVIPASSELPTYRMDRNPRGWCVLINNEKFSVDRGDSEAKEMPPRAGTENDAQLIQHVFNKLGFIVRRYDNLKDSEMNRTLIDVAHNVDHTQFDCFVCCILTHGVLGHLYGSNGRLISIKDLTSTFQTNRCETLAGKPKLFFIQACQGRDKMEGGEVERDGPTAVLGNDPYKQEVDGEREMIPNEADFLLGYATVPGYVSFRSRNHGSWYIRKLCEMLERYADSQASWVLNQFLCIKDVDFRNHTEQFYPDLGVRHDLMSILVEVNREVAHANASMDGGLYKQIPAPFVTLRKQLYFR